MIRKSKVKFIFLYQDNQSFSNKDVSRTIISSLWKEREKYKKYRIQVKSKQGLHYRSKTRN